MTPSTKNLPSPTVSENENPAFANCPHWDFTRAENQAAFAQAVARACLAFPLAVPVAIAAGERFTESRSESATLLRPCPSNTARIVARVCLATADEADRAAEAAAQAWPSWRDRTLEERCALLEALADRLERDRLDLAALEVWEVAKPWAEADADVTEAIDFCRYYARQARCELSPRELPGLPGEVNRLWFEGRGPTLVIAPWNFPLAILTGMTTAALVAGNPVLLKPAEQSSAVGHALFTRLVQTGSDLFNDFSPGVVQFLPGLGEVVGARLATHPLVTQIAFTGSCAVGLEIIRAAGATQASQREVKKVICEMGGKNAIIIDDDADLDAAVAGVLRSAFDYAGQKCSAASRVLVVGKAWTPFTTRLVEAVRSLNIAPADDPACQLGPVIDKEAYDRLMAVIANPGAGAELLYAGPPPPDTAGWFVPPAIYALHDARHRLMQEELFGPVLAVMPVADFETALTVAVDVDYALTGAVFSRRPSHLEHATRAFRVGNLYLNRPCTGAAVGRQPFGGFAMSGLGTKAGGPGYLPHFSVPRAVTENTMRHGFCPEILM